MVENSATQRSRIADELLRTIRDGGYPVGAKLPSERQLAEQFSVSRPVIREALGMLSTLDVIEIQMGRGAFVTNADVEIEQTQKFGLLDIVDTREVIEAGALRLASQRADEQDRQKVAAAFEALEEAVLTGRETTELDIALHLSIVEAARSGMLLKLWSDMTSEIAQTVRISPHGKAMSKEILEDHRRLAAGITSGNVDEALHACSDLYNDHRQFLRSLLG
ncbi:FadR/GntR family transcriptional regulator [Mycolicibacterium brisbanense]|uniref:Regulatory protein GntR HTH n=1 Tax=Mycolicibacterium brisbanense TaxID=146020 RepID=A0A100W731_9MYCO|nr:GntR family transcriptional regulator [Mycolicibacterium brisbanense]MCV7162053.1 FadR family transcriptional regulator [Mycolicibacterium brisbanense]GAS92891.1 regulatory protein GntR HTH [Mycolicibacterium brisbanense]